MENLWRTPQQPENTTLGVGREDEGIGFAMKFFNPLQFEGAVA
jgi:hypothetical protein